MRCICISSLLIFFLCLDDLSWGNPHYTAFLYVCSVKRFPGHGSLRSFEARGELGAGKLSLYRFSGPCEEIINIIIRLQLRVEYLYGFCLQHIILWRSLAQSTR